MSYLFVLLSISQVILWLRHLLCHFTVPTGKEMHEDSLLPPVGRARVNSSYIRNMSNLKLLIPGRHLKLLDTIGQGKTYWALWLFDDSVVCVLGEFGVVYRGHLTGWEERTTAELVAIKTLKSKLMQLVESSGCFKKLWWSGHVWVLQKASGVPQNWILQKKFLLTSPKR